MQFIFNRLKRLTHEGKNNSSKSKKKKKKIQNLHGIFESTPAADTKNTHLQANNKPNS